jgi:hypothetical protein
MVSFKPSIICPEHGDAWGSDPSCRRCCDEDGLALPYRALSTDPGVSRPGRGEAVTENDSTLTGVTEDGVVIEDPATFELRMRAMWLEVQFLRDLRREGEARQVEARMPEDWRNYLAWEEHGIAEHRAKEKRRPIWLFFVGLAVGLVIGGIAIFAVHGHRDSVAAKVQTCETMTGEQAMCLVNPTGENPW